MGGPKVTTLATQRPSMEQIERIRQLSTVVFNSAGKAFTTWGYPSTREAASAQIRRLDGMRTHDDPADIEIPEEEPVTENVAKTCIRCRLAKSIDDFGIDTAKKDGRNQYCKPCKAILSKESLARRKARGGTDVTRRPRTARVETSTTSPSAGMVGSAPPTVTFDPDPPLSLNGDWRARLEDPTLSRLTWIQEALGIPTLDETAAVCRLITEGTSQ
jgi:hypothetical protein